MNNTQQRLDPSHPPSRHLHQKTVFLIAIVIFTLAIAVIWAFNDIGWIPGPWGKLALIFFTWLAVMTAAWALLRGKE